MFDHRRQWLILAIGFWFLAFASKAQAGDGQITSKSKALAHYIMANISELNGQNNEAIKEYKRSIKFDFKQPLPHLKLGAYYLQAAKQVEAIKELQTALKFLPDSTQAHYLLALIYTSENKYSQATNEFEQLLKIGSQGEAQDFQIHSYLAQLYLAQNKIPQSIEQLKMALDLQPNNVSTLILLGSIYSDENEIQKAKEMFNKILVLEPENDEALNALAYIHAEEGSNLDNALKMVQKALEISPNNGAYLDTFGWILFKQGMNAQSLLTLQKASNFLNNSLIYEHMGDVYKASNEPSMARKFWMKALALKSQDPRLSKKIHEIERSSAKIEKNIELDRSIK